MSGADASQAQPGGIAFYMHDLSGGGVERMRLLLIDELRARGRHVILVVQSDEGPLKAMLPCDLPLVVLGRGSTWACLPALVGFLRARRPDFLVASLDHNNIAALLARRLSGTGTRVVICQHNALSAEAALGWKYRLVPFLYRVLQTLADGIVAVSDGVAQDLSAVSGIDPSRITTIYNLSWTRHFTSAPLWKWTARGGMIVPAHSWSSRGGSRGRRTRGRCWMPSRSCCAPCRRDSKFWGTGRSAPNSSRR